MVYFVDDSPQPMWGADIKPYKGASDEKKRSAEYRMTDTKFYRDVWWKDLMRQAREFNIKMTFGMIFSYDDNVSKGFSPAPFYAAQTEGAPLKMARGPSSGAPPPSVPHRRGLGRSPLRRCRRS